MLLIGIFTSYVFGMYVKIRNDMNLTRKYIRDTSSLLFLALMTFLVGCLPHAEWMLHKVFGEPRTQQNYIIVVIAVLAMIANGTREYRAAFSSKQDDSR